MLANIKGITLIILTREKRKKKHEICKKIGLPCHKGSTVISKKCIQVFLCVILLLSNDKQVQQHTHVIKSSTPLISSTGLIPTTLMEKQKAWLDEGKY